MENATVQKKLVSKLAKVMGSIKWVEKRGLNKFFNYKFAQESDVMDAVREKLAAEGVFVTTSIESVDTKATGRKTREGAEIFLTMAKTKHTFHDGETGETLEVAGFGCGEDSSDKGVYKATTGAMKYFVSKNFLMSTGDDPEHDEGDGKREDAQPASSRIDAPKPPAVPDEIKTAWKKLRAAANKSFQEAKTPAEIEAKRKGLEEYSRQGSNLWAMLTYHNETETFDALSQTHMDRVARDNPSTAPEAWRAAVSRANIDRFPYFQEQYNNSPELQTQENSDALASRGRELGLAEYALDDNEIHQLSN